MVALNFSLENSNWTADCKCLNNKLAKRRLHDKASILIICPNFTKFSAHMSLVRSSAGGVAISYVLSALFNEDDTFSCYGSSGGVSLP